MSSSPPSPVALAGAGLLASLLHLGQPRRFLKAFTQWRSSWLSREAILAIATLAVFGLFAALWVFFGLRTRWLGVPAAALALATVFATAMIYAQLRSVPRWRSPLTPVLFLLFALAGGALLAGAAVPAAWLLAALGIAQLAAWPRGDGASPAAGTTLATATGLGALGRLRLLEPPHTGRNYLLREMVFVIGRGHALKLRAVGLLLAVAAAARPAVAAAARHPRARPGRRRPCRGRARPALALLRGGRARGWTLLRKALRHPVSASRSEKRRAQWPNRAQAPHGGGHQPGQPPRLQVAALCWRRSGKGLRVLLITSRDTGRWVIPKGWPMRQRTEAEAAAREAYEEAGVRGIVALAQHRPLHLPQGPCARAAASPARCGSSRSRCARSCAISRDRPAPQPSGSRREKAARRVAEPELAALIRGFDPAAAAPERPLGTRLRPARAEGRNSMTIGSDRRRISTR